MLAKLSFVGALACTASAFGGPDVIPSIDENGMLISKVVANADGVKGIAPVKADGAVKLTPKRVAKINRNMELSSPWYNVTAGDTGIAFSGTLQFDCFDPNATGFPEDTDGCAMGSSRWYFGSTYNNPFCTNDMTLAAGSAAINDGTQHAWYWTNGGQCNIAVFHAEDFDDTCAGPDSGGTFSGVIYDFGAVSSGGYYYYNPVDLTPYGLNMANPADGVGANVHLLGSFNGTTFFLASTAQFMLWGTSAARAGSQGEIQWDDDAPTDGMHSAPTECYTLAFGLCPDPLGIMYASYGDLDDCPPPEDMPPCPPIEPTEDPCGEGQPCNSCGFEKFGTFFATQLDQATNKFIDFFESGRAFTFAASKSSRFCLDRMEKQLEDCGDEDQLRTFRENRSALHETLSFGFESTVRFALGAESAEASRQPIKDLRFPSSVDPFDIAPPDPSRMRFTGYKWKFDFDQPDFGEMSELVQRLSDGQVDEVGQDLLRRIDEVCLEGTFTLGNEWNGSFEGGYKKPFGGDPDAFARAKFDYSTRSGLHFEVTLDKTEGRPFSRSFGISYQFTFLGEMCDCCAE